MLRHRLRKSVEKRSGEIGRRVMRSVGAFVAPKEQSPIALLDHRARFSYERDACVGKLLTLLADFFALVVRECRQEIGEVAVSGIVPVKLDTVPRDQTGCFAVSRLIVVEEQ